MPNTRHTNGKVQQIVDLARSLTVKERVEMEDRLDEIMSHWCPFCFEDLDENGSHPCFDEVDVDAIVKGTVREITKPKRHH